MNKDLLTVPESYTGPQIENPVLREWIHLTGLPFGSLILVDGVLYQSVPKKGGTEASFDLYGNFTESISGPELLSAFIESRIILLRVGIG